MKLDEHTFSLLSDAFLKDAILLKEGPVADNYMPNFILRLNDRFTVKAKVEEILSRAENQEPD